MIFSGCTCKETYTPKPAAYPRVVLPTSHAYKPTPDSLPYAFKYSENAQLQPVINQGAEPYWLNIHYPSLQATLFLSYKSFQKLSELNEFLEDAHKLTYKHVVRASAIEEAQINKPAQKVYGLLYQVAGNAASPMQFYLTDSTKHYVRLALYFETSPNADSIAPYLTYVKQDVLHLIDSFQWK